MSTELRSWSLRNVLLVGGLAAQSALLFFLLRKLRQLERRRAEADETAGDLRVDFNALKLRLRNLELRMGDAPERRSVSFAPMPSPPFAAAEVIPAEPLSRVTSMTSTSDYLDAQEEWPSPIEFEARGGGDFVFAPTKKSAARKALATEAYEHAKAAHKLAPDNGNVLKWCAKYLDGALVHLPADYGLLHMRGRFNYSCANLSWLERKAASALFGTPPTGSIDDALKATLPPDSHHSLDFLAVETLRPAQWIENLLYVAQCYVAKKDKQQAGHYLTIAVQIKPADASEQEALEEVKKLLKKL
ncbi:hypothetical protein M3Y99_01464800 [Aphelenchoides fujianensis]|nr:hypothetical protein M3Y99_01464800 [Aphelenchoides fujianensis]